MRIEAIEPWCRWENVEWVAVDHLDIERVDIELELTLKLSVMICTATYLVFF